MKIVWKENPLATVVELDEHDKQMLRLRLENEDLRERIVEAHFNLAPDSRGWHNKHVGPRTLEEAVAAALRVLAPEPEPDAELDRKLAAYVIELAGEHCGDCTCVAASCMKCHAEELVGVDTTRGLGKHEGSYVAGAFTPRVKGGPVPSLAEAIEHLRDYRPVKGPAWAKHTDEEFQQHVPRWRAEAKRAHAWLVAYQQEHFADSRPLPRSTQTEGAKEET